MKKSFDKLIHGYEKFRDKYVHGDQSIMPYLSHYGQKPETMVIACCDSRVDPALILQCDPGDLFVVRNVANIIPPYEKDASHHGTSAALEFGVCFLKVKHIILLGHSQCGGIQGLLNQENLHQDDFITSWVSLIEHKFCSHENVDAYARDALHISHKNCLTFPWIEKRINAEELKIHLWFFDIQKGAILEFDHKKMLYKPLGALEM